MLRLGFRKQKKPSRSVCRDRDGSADSVIFTPESNFSHHSSASESVDRCSFASDVHNHKVLVSELSKKLAGTELHESSTSPDLDPSYRSTVHKNCHPTKDRNKAKDHKEEETEDDNQTLAPAKNLFSLALTECWSQQLRSEALNPERDLFSLALTEFQNRPFRSEVLSTVTKPDRQRPTSLDLNNPRSNATNPSPPLLGGMRKNSISSCNSGTFPSPVTPNYGQGSVGLQKGWSSERVPMPTKGSRRNVGAALLPFSSGRTLPSKWEDAEKWISSPIAGDGVSRHSVPQPQRRPKSKSGPLGAPGLAYYSTYSPAMPMFEGRSGGDFMLGSPFSTGVLVADGLPGHGHRSSSGDETYLAHTEACIIRSASVHGCLSDQPSQSLSAAQDQKLDGSRDAETMISHAVSRRDMATQMSPEGSTHSSPKERPSYSPSPSSFLPIVELKSRNSSKLEVRDVQVDDRVTMTRWSKKHIDRGPERCLANVGNKKKKAAEIQTSDWEVSEATRCVSKLRREEARITAWENLQKAKAEAAIQKLEVKLEKKRSSSMDKILEKLRLAQRKAQEMRSSLSTNQDHQVAGTSNKNVSFHKPTWMGFLSGCFTCRVF